MSERQGSFLKQFDIFRKMPRDLTEPTFCGALVSVVCTFVLFALTIYEVQNYLNAESHAELIIDTSHRDDFVDVNVDVVFPRMPCDILSLDVQDILGTHKTDIMGELKKIRLDKNGNKVSEETPGESNDFHQRIKERAIKELNDGQGCRYAGSFKVYRVPGNFHLASHAFGDVVHMLKQEGVNLDYSYKINHVSFGNKRDFDYIQRKFTDLYMDHPMDGISEEPQYFDNGTKAKSFKSMFYIVAVPSYFEKGMGKYHVYQLVQNYEVTHDEKKTHGESILMFNFEFSPITENITQNKQTLVDFLISICAIIGGVYTIAGIVDSVIYRSVSYVFKNRIGKLA